VEDNALLFWILCAAFAAVGLHMILYSRRRRRMLESFAEKHQFKIKPDHEGAIQKVLDTCFSLKSNNLVRSFGQLSSLVDGGTIWLFRSIELLDLNPYGKSESTHFPRIAALFDISKTHNAFFVLGKSMQTRPMIPGAAEIKAEVARLATQSASACDARHPLSVTLAQGHALIYFEPLVTGGEKPADVEALYCIAQNMRHELASD
jgi:hypothetical protein